MRVVAVMANRRRKGGRKMRSRKPEDRTAARERHERWRTLRRMLRAQGGMCALCGEVMSFVEGDPRRATIDHIVPASKGGTDAPSNLRAACSECNNKRGNATEGEG